MHVGNIDGLPVLKSSGRGQRNRATDVAPVQSKVESPSGRLGGYANVQRIRVEGKIGDDLPIYFIV